MAGKLVDFCIQVGQYKFRAHKLVLAEKSEYLNRRLAGVVPWKISYPPNISTLPVAEALLGGQRWLHRHEGNLTSHVCEVARMVLFR